MTRLLERHTIRAQHNSKQPGGRYTKPAVAAPNRLWQPFAMDRPDWAWVSDMTSIRIDEGWLYLAVGRDPYSRRIIG